MADLHLLFHAGLPALSPIQPPPKLGVIEAIPVVDERGLAVMVLGAEAEGIVVSPVAGLTDDVTEGVFGDIGGSLLSASSGAAPYPRRTLLYVKVLNLPF